MLPSPITDIKAFVPARDLNLSKAFYTDLGFIINWSTDEIAELQVGSFRFLLQKFYVAQHAGNFMITLNVDQRRCLVELHPAKGVRQEVPRHYGASRLKFSRGGCESWI
jgi:hypothetical protein